MTSVFDSVELLPEKESVLVSDEFHEDPREDKILLARRFYSANGAVKPSTPKFVKEAYLKAAESVAVDKSDLGYLPPLGSREFGEECAKLLLGKNAKSIDDGLVLGAQTAGGGTGALRLGMEFLARNLFSGKGNKIYYYLSQQTWSAHYEIFQGSGFGECRSHRYLDNATKTLDISGMLQDLRAAPEGSVVVLHTSSHNPTGMDPTQDQWRKIAKVFQERKHLAFFDCAFMGFASGSIDTDAFPVRLFDQLGLEFLAAQCFSKNMGLTNERVGHLTIRFAKPNVKDAVASQLSALAGILYSSPPAHGALVVLNVLQTPRLLEAYKDHVRTIRDTDFKLRKLLRSNLEKFDAKKRDWSYVTATVGMFVMFDFSERQWKELKFDKGIHTYRKRIGMFGLTPENVEFVVKSILETEED